LNPRWKIAPPALEACKRLQTELRLSALSAQCLVNRGLGNPESAALFLDPKLKSLSDPFLLPGMRAGASRLLAARERGERLVIFGDYDVDGVSATVILLEFMRTFGWKVEWYLPHRVDEGYGLTQVAVEACVEKFTPKLLIATDCGSTSVQQIEWLAQKGIDAIVLDHHQVSTPPPRAAALINPQLGNQFHELCSAGLAFKLIHALVKEARLAGVATLGDADIRHWLDLVALGTIADIVPLTGENRILVSTGLARLNAAPRPGLEALREVARSPKRIGAAEVGFQLGPRLNAAGRLESANAALELLMAGDRETASPLAAALDAQNRERQQIERRTAAEAVGRIRKKFDPARDFAIVEGDAAWHIGVVGIVASRVLREFYRPTIILGGDNGALRGSGRSIPGFDLAAGLRQCNDILTRHGGHAMAAGVSLDPAQLGSFRQRLNHVASERIAVDDLVPELRLDAVCSLMQITSQFLNELQRLEPFGQGNPQVQIAVGGLRHARPPQLLKEEHWKMWVTDGENMMEAVWWGAGEKACPTKEFALAAVPERSEFNGMKRIQLRVLGWQEKMPEVG
jgi:single-stranded-DNA-specific exonuclease